MIVKSAQKLREPCSFSIQASFTDLKELFGVPLETPLGGIVKYTLPGLLVGLPYS